MSFGGGKSDSSSTQNMATMGIGPLLGLSALGYQFSPNQGGLGITPFNQGMGGPGLSTSLGPAWLGGGQLGSLGGLLQSMPLGPAEQMGLEGIPSELALNSLGSNQEGIASLFQNLYSAGQPTDINPIVNAAQSFLRGERTRLREEMGGRGAFESDINAAYARTEGDTAAQLGTLDFQAQEAAKERASGNLTSGLQGVALDVNNILQTFGGLFGLEDASREAARSETAGGRTADVLSWLAGLTGPVGNVGSSESESFNWSACWVAAEYYGWYTPEWWNARTWILEGWNTVLGRLFRAFYLVHGPVVAQLVRSSEELRERWRPLFVWCERCGRELTRGRY